MTCIQTEVIKGDSNNVGGRGDCVANSALLLSSVGLDWTDDALEGLASETD